MFQGAGDSPTGDSPTGSSWQEGQRWGMKHERTVAAAVREEIRGRLAGPTRCWNVNAGRRDWQSALQRVVSSYVCPGLCLGLVCLSVHLEK